MDACKLNLHAIPFRGDEFERLWAPAAARVMSYGSTGYTFVRDEEDPLHFVHISYWNDRLDFDRYWFSDEMQQLRTEVTGLYQVPLLPHWGRLIGQR